MAREKYQTRLAADHAEAVDRYADERGVSQSEAVRRLIVAGLEAKREEEEEEEAEASAEGAAERTEEEERIYNLARLGEKAAIVGIATALLAGIIPIGAGLLIVAFDLTLGTFGANVIVYSSTILFVAATVALVVSALFVGESLIRYGIKVGPVGKRLDRYLDQDAPAGPEVAA